MKSDNLEALRQQSMRWHRGGCGEPIALAQKFRAAASRGDELGLNDDEIRFCDSLADNESAVRELSDETLKKIAHELTENLGQNQSVGWSARESVRARLHLMVKRILRKCKYPPDQQEAAVELVLRQAEALGEAWAQGRAWAVSRRSFVAPRSAGGGAAGGRHGGQAAARLILAAVAGQRGAPRVSERSQGAWRSSPPPAPDSHRQTG